MVPGFNKYAVGAKLAVCLRVKHPRTGASGFEHFGCLGPREVAKSYALFGQRPSLIVVALCKE